MKSQRTLLLGAAGVAAMLAASPAAAAQPIGTADPPPAPLSVAAPLAVEGDTQSLVDLEALDDSELAEARGGAQAIVTNQTLVALTSGNVLNGDYVAGAVTLSDNALMGFNGIGNLLINTGAQVSLQTGMNLTVNVDQ